MTIIRHLYGIKLTFISTGIYCYYHDLTTGIILVALAILESMVMAWSNYLDKLPKLDKTIEIESRLQRVEAMLASIDAGRGY